MTDDPPTGGSLGRHATLYHVYLGMLERGPGPRGYDGARFTAREISTSGPERIVVEYPNDDALAEAWESVLFESAAHANEVLADD